MPIAGRQFSDGFQVASKVWRYGCIDDVAGEGAGGGKCPAMQDVHRGDAQATGAYRRMPACLGT